jgi:hypothetical protein
MTAEEAFFACTFLEENAQIELQAEIMGGAIALSEAEARDCAEGTFNPPLLPLLWAFYEREAGRGREPVNRAARPPAAAVGQDRQPTR